MTGAAEGRGHSRGGLWGIQQVDGSPDEVALDWKGGLLSKVRTREKGHYFRWKSCLEMVVRQNSMMGFPEGKKAHPFC